jgi:hypothetical protein
VAPPTAHVDVDLGEGVVVDARELVPTRYANATHFDVFVHPEGANVVSTSGESSFAVELASTGGARACRSRDIRSSLDGPKVSNATYLRDRQAYVGTWAKNGPWIDVDLSLADTAECPQLRAYVDLAPAPWKLRCLSLTRVGALALDAPALACRLGEGTKHVYDETHDHLLTHIFPGEWMVLGSGNGIVAEWKESGVGLFTEKNAVVTLAPSPTTLPWRAAHPP